MLPKTIVNGYNTGRPLEGELRHCFLCNTDIYVRKYRLDGGFFCRQCSSKYAGNKRTWFSFQLVKRMARLIHEKKALQTERYRVTKEIKQLKNTLRDHQKILATDVMNNTMAILSISQRLRYS